MGATIFVVYGASATAPLLSGWVYDVTGSYRALFLLMQLLTLTTTAFIPLLRIPASFAENVGARPVAERLHPA